MRRSRPQQASLKIAQKATDQGDSWDDEDIHKNIRENPVEKKESVEEKWDDEAPEPKKAKFDSEETSWDDAAQKKLRKMFKNQKNSMSL